MIILSENENVNALINAILLEKKPTQIGKNTNKI